MLFKKSLRCMAGALVTVFMLSSTALAAIPNNTIIIGTKAYDISLLNNAGMANEIKNAYHANGNTFYYKNPAGNLCNTSASTVNATVLPAVTYKNASTTTQYAQGDGNEVTAPATVTVTAIATQTVEVGKSVDVTVTTTSADASITATSSDTAKATVAVAGSKITVTGVSAGEATVTVTAAKAGLTNGTTTFKVTVTAPAGLTATASADVQVGAGAMSAFKTITVKTYSLTDGVKYKVGTSTNIVSLGQPVSYMTSDPSVTVYILNVSNVTVAEGSLNVSAAATSTVINLTVKSKSVVEKTATFSVQVGAGAMSAFKTITMLSAPTGVTGAANYKIGTSTKVNSFSDNVSYMTSDSSVPVYILNASGVTIAEGSLNVSAAASSIVVNLTATTQPVVEKKATFNVQVGAGAMSAFKTITMQSAPTGVTGAASYKVGTSTKVNSFSDNVSYMTSESTVQIYILDGSSATIATGTLPVSQAANNVSVTLQ